MKLRPLHDWVLVKQDPLPTLRGSLYIPYGGNVRTATVLRTGPGTWENNRRVPTGLEPGDKVAYFRWNEEHQQGKQVGAALKELGEDLALIRLPDILFTYPRDEKIRIDTP